MVCPRHSHLLDVRLSVTILSVWFALGIVIVLFFQCMTALFNPVHRRGERIKWGLVCYTATMFSLTTVFTTSILDLQSISYIDNREFPGVDTTLPPGPLGYQWFLYSDVLTIVPNLMFLLNNWMADGLLVGSSLMLPPLAQVSNAAPSSFIVAMLSTP